MGWVREKRLVTANGCGDLEESGGNVLKLTVVTVQETPGVTGKFGLGVQNEAGQRLIEFCQENALVIANTFFNNTREDSTHGHHQMAKTDFRLIIFFAAKNGEALYSQQKQDWEETVTQIMASNHLYLCHSFLLPHSIFPSIRVFSKYSVLRFRWPKY